MTQSRKPHVRIGKSGWKQHMSDWQASGLTQAAYCREQGLNERYFSQWKKKLLNSREEDMQSMTGAGFVPVEVLPAESDKTISIELPNGIRISIPATLPSEQLLVILQKVMSLLC